jgi:formylglycine-generating enzyme required for sulfatase activity
LKEVGGTEGIGVTFLEGTFSATSAPPEHRYHQRAARAVLKALLPESGSDIKGHMRSHGELLAASGYVGRAREFDDLLRILDSELRLITPTDPEGQDGDVDALSPAQAGQKYYQLTHDYLVHSLRDWLTRKQRETRRGRAELRLAERAAAWNTKPENRHLPAWWEWGNIRLYTRKRDWTPPQRRMMRRAGPYHVVRGGLVAFALGVLTFAGWRTFGALEARSRVENLLTAKTADVTAIIHGLEPYRRWADPLLRERSAQTDLGESKQLHVALALLPVDVNQIDYLCDRLLTAKGPDEVKVIRELLHEHAPDPAARFWPLLLDDVAERSRRLRAACVLALFDETDPRWGGVADELVRCMAGENLLQLRDWAELLEPVRKHLVPHQARRLTEADAGGFAAYLAMLRSYPENAPAALHGQLDRALPATAKQEDREALARQHAQAGVALLLLGQGERVWPLFHQGQDPTCRTYLIHRCASLGVDPAVLANRLLGGLENDPSVRQGLILALGEYSADQRAEVVRGPLVERVLEDYENNPDPGAHSAAGWLLSRWKMTDRLAKVDQKLIKARPVLAQGKIDKPRWCLNGQGQTFAVIPAPGKFGIGSLPTEKGRSAHENREQVQIDYSFAVATKLVTVAEFRRCLPGFVHANQFSPEEDTPVNGVSWYDAAMYCNWLSEQEKIPKDQWCYKPNARGAYAEGMKLKTNYKSLAGYRLPSELELEHACRAGTVTAWSHGSDEAMLRQYAWYDLNSNLTMHPVGSLKPNGLGLFDMHGNAWQWCQDAYEEKHNEEDEEVKDYISRVLRGSSFAYAARFARSASRLRYEPANRSNYNGFRVAKTYR